MPLYAYRCRMCSAHEEHIQKFSDPPIAACSSCGGVLEKLLTATAFHLKGGGWYRDGYASTKPDAGGSSAGSDGGDKGPKKADAGEAKGKGGSSEGGVKAATG